MHWQFLILTVALGYELMIIQVFNDGLG